MANKIKVKKLSNGKYEVKETPNAVEQTSHIDKRELEIAIKVLKDEIATSQNLLAYKEELLEEIKKVE